MENDVAISSKSANVIVQICFAIKEFSRFYDDDHPKSAKKVFQINESLQEGIFGLLAVRSQLEFQMRVAEYLDLVKTTKQVYHDIKVPIQKKEEIILQLSDLQKFLDELKMEMGSK